MNKKYTDLDGQPADAETIEKILEQLAHTPFDNWGRGREIENFITSNPEILSDSRLLGIFWKSLLAASRESSSTKNKVAVALDRFPVPAQLLGELLFWFVHYRYRNRFETRPVLGPAIKILGTPTRRDLLPCLEAFSSVERLDRLEVLDYLFRYLFPLCQEVRPEARQALGKIVSEKVDPSLLGDVELCLFFHWFSLPKNGLLRIYNSLPEFEMRQPTPDELMEVGQTNRYRSYFKSDDCTFRLFIEQLRLEEGRKNLAPPSKITVIEKDILLA